MIAGREDQHEGRRGPVDGLAPQAAPGWMIADLEQHRLARLQALQLHAVVAQALGPGLGGRQGLVGQAVAAQKLQQGVVIAAAIHQHLGEVAAGLGRRRWLKTRGTARSVKRNHR